MNHRQPETGALADPLGREERLRSPCKRRAVHAHAGVGGEQPHITPRLQPDGIALVDHDIDHGEDQPAATRHRVAGIDRKVE